MRKVYQRIMKLEKRLGKQRVEDLSHFQSLVATQKVILGHLGIGNPEIAQVPQRTKLTADTKRGNHATIVTDNPITGSYEL